MFGLQPIHLIFILLVAIVIFVPQRLPELVRGLGKSVTEFKKAILENPEPTSHNGKETPKTKDATHSE